MVKESVKDELLNKIKSLSTEELIQYIVLGLRSGTIDINLVAQSLNSKRDTTYKILKSVYSEFPEKVINFIRETPPEDILDFFMLSLNDHLGVFKACLDIIDLTISDYYYFFLVIKSESPEYIILAEEKLGYFKSFGVDANKVKDFSRVEPIRGYFIGDGIESIVEMIYLKNTEFYKKSLLKQMFKRGESAPDFKVANFLVKIRKQIPSFPSDKLVNFDGDSVEILNPDDVNFCNFSPVVDLFGEERAIKLMCKSVDRGILNDTVEMFRSLYSQVNFTKNQNIKDKFTGKNLRSEFPKKPKNFKIDIHDRLTSILDKIDQEPFNLGIELVSFLDGVEIPGTKLHFYVPKESSELIDVGRSLNICVGNGHYAKKTIKHEGQSNIVVACKGNKFIYCIEVNPDMKIIQIKAHSNSAPTSEDLKKIKKIISKR